MTDPQIPFNGDYQQTLTAYQSLQSQVTPLQQQLAEMKTANEQLQAQVQQLISQTQSKPETPPNTDSGGGQSLYDWHSGQMRTQDGAIDPNLVTALGKAGASPEVVENLVNIVEGSHQIGTMWQQQQINSVAGGQSQFDQLTTWAGENASNPMVAVASTLLKDVRTMGQGLEVIKAEYEKAGGTLSATQQPQQQAQQNPLTGGEPSQLPVTGGGGPGGITPLDPNDPATARVVSEAYKSGDKAKIEQVQVQLKAGMVSS